jgi:hypothetical protein
MFKSPFARIGFVTDTADRQESVGVKPSRNIITGPTIMTATRPPLALKVNRKLVRGEKGALPYAIAMAGSDMEGKLGWLIDTLWPNSGRGSSEFGEQADLFADATALLLVGGGALRGPRVPLEAKTGVGLILAQEGLKAAWGVRANSQYKSAGGEGVLNIPASVEGRSAMAEKFTGILLAVAAHEADDPRLRHTIGAASFAMCAIGAARGQLAQNEYHQRFDYILQDLQENLAPHF